MNTSVPTPPIAPLEVSFPVVGMTCASCSNRIERFLRKTDGVVEASVNLATEIATIRYLPEQVGRSELVGAIEKAGYEVRPGALEAASAGTTVGGAAAADTDELDETEKARAKEAREMALQSAVAIGVAVGIMALMFWPGLPLSMHDVNRLVLWPATFVQFWAGRRYYEAAWRSLRHGFGTNMSTLVAVGTTAAWAYSVFVTMWPESGHAGRARRRDLLRFGRDHHRPDPAREVARGPRQGTRDRRDQAPRRPPGEDRAPGDPRRRPRRRHRERRSSATSSGFGRGRRCPSTASSPRGAPRSTRRC